MERDNVKSRISELRTDFSEKTSENIYGMEEQAAKETNYLDLKKAAKELNEELEKLKKSFDKELAVAQESGMTPERANRVAELAQEISEKTVKSVKYAEDIKNIEDGIRLDVKDTVVNGVLKVRDAFKNIANNMIDKAVAGVATIGAMADKVSEANRKAIGMVKAEVDTVYTKAEESINQVHRNYLSFNYNKDKSITETLDKVTDTLEKSFQKSASIKEAFKDLGRAFMGKERQGDKGEYTKAEKFIVEKLRGMSDGLKQEMSDMEKQFNISKAVSLQNIKSLQELREGAGLEKSESLQNRFDKAKEQSIDSKRDAAEKTAEKAAEDKKYELTGEYKVHEGKTLHRIKALKDFGDVKAGDLGGWVESEKNLSQSGNSWVYDDAKVSGNARVEDDATVHQNASVEGSAQIRNSASIWKDAIVTDFVEVRDDAKIGAQAKASGHAKISGRAGIAGNALVKDNAIIKDNARIFDDAVVREHATVSENATVKGISEIWGNSHVHGDVKMIDSWAQSMDVSGDQLIQYENVVGTKTKDVSLNDRIEAAKQAAEDLKNSKPDNTDRMGDGQKEKFMDGGNKDKEISM